MHKLQMIVNTYIPQIDVLDPFQKPQLRIFNIVFLDLKNFTKFSSEATLSAVTELIDGFYDII